MSSLAAVEQVQERLTVGAMVRWLDAEGEKATGKARAALVKRASVCKRFYSKVYGDEYEGVTIGDDYQFDNDIERYRSYHILTKEAEAEYRSRVGVSVTKYRALVLHGTSPNWAHKGTGKDTGKRQGAKANDTAAPMPEGYTVVPIPLRYAEGRATLAFPGDTLHPADTAVIIRLVQMYTEPIDPDDGIGPTAEHPSEYE